MREILAVREFDTIICNEEYKDSPYFRYLEERHFRELDRFIREYVSETEETDIREFLKVGNRKNVGDTISICNYVGIIELPSGFQLEILPKIHFAGDSEAYGRTKQIFLQMLRCLREFEGKSFGSAALNADHMNLYEIFIRMFLTEVQKLVKRGLKSDYLSRDENIGYYKGKLLVSQQIRTNFAHRERFYMQYDEYQVNRPENRLIKATLLKLQRLSVNADNIREIRQVLGHFELVEPSVNYQKDFAQVVSDRTTKDYQLLLTWARIFLMNKSFTTFSGETSGKALLFPMEKVFEAFVARWVTELFEADERYEVTVSSQDSGYYLFDQPRKFRLRPDLVAAIKTGDGIHCKMHTVILDTKWKNLKADEATNYGIAQADMYQMYAYAKKYHTSEVWLLYPLNQDFAGDGSSGNAHRDGAPPEPITYQALYGEEQEIRVRIFLVDLEHYEQSISDLYARVTEGYESDIDDSYEDEFE